MRERSLSTPVALFIYNRPETTERVFEQIAEAEPPEFYVVADGPKNETDADQCLAARNKISVDWECDYWTNYADENLGLRERLSSGLDWVFDNTDRAIILEDDTLPHPDFFGFCEEILDEYEDDDRIMHVTGTNMVEEWRADSCDYFFSFLGGIWGWATWRDAWQEYDREMSTWEEIGPECLQQVLHDREISRWLTRNYQETHDGAIDTWDHQWDYSKIRNHGLSVIPSRNLVSNIGFGESATHTVNKDDERAAMSTFNCEFPIDHPTAVYPDRQYHEQYYDAVGASRLKRILSRVYSRFRSPWE
jgi:hypothetical protein